MPGRTRVVLIEDEPAQAQKVIDLMAQHELSVHWANRGLDGFKAVIEHQPDVVLLDVVLPDQSGHEICRFLKAEARTRDIPVLMLTSRASVRDRVEGLNLGADEFLPKPFDDDELLARIHALLRLKALQDQLKERNRNLTDLLARMEAMAVTDALTGLYNRRHFMVALENEYTRFSRYGGGFVLAFLDVDFFKSINDTWGHPTGDCVLESLGAILREATRRIDVTARYGGEEFAILMPQTTLETAMLPARRVLERVRAQPFSGVERQVTVSIGLAAVPDPRVRSVEQLVKLADDALYAAKHAGRDRVEVAVPPP